MSVKRNVNQELEKLIKEVEVVPNYDTLILNLQRQTTRIHAGYLFEEEGKALRYELCVALSATAVGKCYGNWQDFAAEIGLTGDLIRVIEYNYIGPEVPTFYVLQSYVQSMDSTLDKVISSLANIKRLDIIERIKDHVEKLIDALDHKGYLNGPEIIHPGNKISVAEILRPLEQDNEISANKIKYKVNQPEIIPRQIKKPIQKYATIVMLTFVKNDLETACRVAALFRSKEPKIGVIILQEQQKHVYSGAEEFIEYWFQKVRYIIPILTGDYIKAINAPITQEIQQPNTTLDHQYLRYLYTRMRNEYTKNCRNNRVRCLVPDNELTRVRNTTLHPILNAWFRESDINTFTENVHSKRF